MIKLARVLILLALAVSAPLSMAVGNSPEPVQPLQRGATCADPLDTFDRYDRKARERQRHDVRPHSYVLSYSWSPNYCGRRSARDKQPGGKDYLQCGSGRSRGYILHGLWPQGRPGQRHPRLCEGDQPKIPRAELEPFLCMTPSLSLLQHEYEYHGTCMHDEALETPTRFFGIALKLHQTMKLPPRELRDSRAGWDWWLRNNTHIRREGMYYSGRSKEWRFCFDLAFKPTACAR